MKEDHIKILEFLKEKGIGKSTDISGFIKQNFAYSVTLNTTKHNALVPRNILRDLRYKGLINSVYDLSIDTWATEQMENKEYPIWINNFGSGLNTHELPYYITLEGIDYLNRHISDKLSMELNQSNKDLNRAIGRNIKSQKWFTWATFIVAFVVAVFSIGNYFKSEPKMAELNRNIQALSIEAKGIKSELNTLRYQIASHPVLSHKP